MQGLLPAQVRLAVQNRQGWAYVPAETVQPGNLTVVLPGDCVPVDGTVVEGASSLNESALTGEPMPVTVSTGVLADVLPLQNMRVPYSTVAWESTPHLTSSQPMPALLDVACLQACHRILLGDSHQG